MVPLPISDCKDTCENHQAAMLLVKQHEERIHQCEEHFMDISNDNSNLEGRVTIFIWIIGLAALLVCSIAFYGIIQLDAFKKVYMADTRKIDNSINALTVRVETVNYTVGKISEEVNGMKKDVRELSDGE